MINQKLGFCKNCKQGFAFKYSINNNEDFCSIECEEEFKSRSFKTIIMKRNKNDLLKDNKKSGKINLNLSGDNR